MKKPIQEYIDFTVKIAKSNKSIRLSLINTTKLEKISHMLSKKLGLNKNLTKICYSKFEFPHPMSGIHTLRQINLRNGDILNADIRSSCEPTNYETGVPYSFDTNVRPKVMGWSHKYEDVQDAFVKKTPVSTRMIRGDPHKAQKVAQHIKQLKKQAWQRDLSEIEIPKSKLENIERKL